MFRPRRNTPHIIRLNQFLALGTMRGQSCRYAAVRFGTIWGQFTLQNPQKNPQCQCGFVL
ncbi:hypothetical protein THIX_70139 [Thiomonas sp. X19]|nr:hypothetical protein THIX_70139 [Thiomonas sp. X19]